MNIGAEEAAAAAMKMSEDARAQLARHKISVQNHSYRRKRADRSVRPSHTAFDVAGPLDEPVAKSRNAEE